MERVTVEASATSANLGPGFDVFALALGDPVDRVDLSSEGRGRLEVRVEVDGGPRLPTAAARNSAGAVVLSISKKFGLEGRIRVGLRKGVPVGVGLGSSGASSAAAAVAMDRMFGLKLTVRELVSFAGVGEKAASGAAHLDNVTAAILGGFVVVFQKAGVDPLRFEPPESVRLVVVTPRVELPPRKTEYARSLLPREVKLGDVVRNISMASLMVAGFARRDISAIGEGMEDLIVEPARAKIVPGLEGAKKAAKEAGAAGACLSGAGPSVLSMVDGSRVDPSKVLGSVLRFFKKKRVDAKGYVTSAGKGARVIEGP